MAAYWGIAAHSAYDMFSWYKYLSVILVFSHPSVYGVGISFRLIAPFPDHCLLVLFYKQCLKYLFRKNSALSKVKTRKSGVYKEEGREDAHDHCYTVCHLLPPGPYSEYLDVSGFTLISELPQ